MAHIKVVRRSMRPEEWNDLRFGWLKRYIINDKLPIDNIVIKDARQVTENNYEFYSDEFRPLKKGDLYFTPDGTAFIKAETEVPDSLKNKELWLYLKTAAEIIVKANGKFVGGIDPNRDRVLLTPYIGTPDKIKFEMQGYNRSKPDDERNPESLAVRGCRQIFNGAYLVTIDRDVQSLVYDIETLLDIAKSELFNEDYRKFVNTELNNALNLIDFDTDRRPTGIKEAKKYVNDVIFANRDYKGSGDVALVAHSHLDIAYYWRRIHAVQKNLRTVLIQLRLMDRYPEFKYTHTQAYTYESLKQYYPEVFEELKKRVKEGRFEPVGAMYIEPDCNIPSAESLIRQCFYGQLFFRENFGKTINNCWLPDVFGNSWILPQILKKCGVDYFVSNKMSTWNDTNRFPHNNFIWKGIDGSEVYACVPPTHFITWNMPSQIQENWEAYQDKNSGGQTMSMFGYGDGGSGVTEEMLEVMRRFDKISVMPKTKHMGGAEFLEKNLKGNTSLAKWDGELYLEMHRGTFTTKANLKKLNRRLEYKIREAEIISTLRAMSGFDYPGEKLKECYKKLLINQFHDILPGSHINPVYNDALADYVYVDKTLSGIIGYGEAYFNSLNFKRKELTFFEDEDGSETRFGKKGFWTVPNIAPLDCTVIEKPDEEFSDEWCIVNGNSAETPFYKIKFASDGSITGLYDKRLDREWVNGAFNRLEIYEDNPGVYDAWDILPNYTDKIIPLKVVSPLKLTEKSGEACSFRVTLGTENSKWERIIRIFRRSPKIEVENNVDWHEKHKLAKVLFSPNVLSREVLCDTGAGFIARETHKNTSWQSARFECCHHKWFDVSETDGGIAVINDSKYGIGISENTLSLSLLRATERPDPESDIGKHSFAYLIYPHSGSAVDAHINDIAFEFNIPLTRADVSCQNTFDGMFLQAMKLSEDGEMVVVRLSEQNGRRGKMKFPQQVYVLNMLEDKLYLTDEIDYKPFEIITIGILR